MLYCIVTSFCHKILEVIIMLMLLHYVVCQFSFFFPTELGIDFSLIKENVSYNFFLKSYRQIPFVFLRKVVL